MTNILEKYISDFMAVHMEERYLFISEVSISRWAVHHMAYIQR